MDAYARRQLVVGLLPRSRCKNALLRWLGYSVHPTAEIHPVLLLGVQNLVVEAHARIGLLTTLRGLRHVVLEEHARIGQLNWITAAPDIVVGPSAAALEVGEHSAITNRHYLDCTGGLFIGRRTTVAGVRSTIITHGIDHRRSVQSAEPVRVGSYCIVSSNVCITPGASLPDRSVVGMGTTVDRRSCTTDGLVVGGRGTVVKAHLEGDYFERQEGVVRAPTS